MEKRDAIASKNFLRVSKIIPEYQRDFVWSSKDVHVFLNDVYSAFEDKNEKNDYYIGSMVFEETSKDDEFLVIDGQQRITTVHLIISIGAFLLNKRETHIREVQTLNVAYIFDEDNQEKQRLKGESFFNDLLNNIHDYGTKNIDLKTKNAAVRSIWNATKEITNFFENFDNTKTGNQRLLDFIKYITSQVKFSYTTSKNQQDSLTVFERLNSSGKVLSELEILKGLLFKNSLEWDDLKEKWDDFKKSINNSEIKTDKIFLRHFVSIYYKNIVIKNHGHSNGLIRTSEIINIIKSKSILTSEPSKTINNILNYLNQLKNLQSGKDIFGKDSDIIKNINEITNSKAHNLFLCQAKDTIVFHTAALISQVQTTINKVLGHYTGTTEQRFASWSRMIHEGYENGNSSAEISKKLAVNSYKEFKSDWLEVENKFNDLRYDRGNNCEIVCKLVEIYINKEIKKPLTDGLQSSFFNKSSLDHIEPQNSTNFENYGSHNIGNLALLSGSPNAAIQDKAINTKEKSSAYRDSQFYTTKYLIDTEKSHGGSEGKMRGVFKRINSSQSDWSLAETENRRKLYQIYLRRFLLEELESESMTAN